MSDIQAIGAAAEDRIAVASNWKLVWWRFRRHHLALFSAGVLICLYLVVLCPDFFSTQDPQQTDARQAFIPVQTLHLFDDGWDPWVPAIVGKRNPVTLRMEWTTDPQRKVPRRLLHPRRAVPRARPVRDQHPSASAPSIRASASSCSAPTGSAAISGRASCAARRPR